MLDLKRWKASYSVGNWLLDNQHRVLLSLCEDAIELVPEDNRRDMPDPGFRDAQDDLLFYIEEHFNTEERLLKRCGQSIYERHHKEHAYFWEMLREKLQEIANGEIGREEFRQFLTEWWSYHILQSDRSFSQVIQRIG